MPSIKFFLLHVFWGLGLLLLGCENAAPLFNPRSNLVSLVSGKTFVNQDTLCLESSEPPEADNIPCISQLKFWDHVEKVNVTQATLTWVAITYNIFPSSVMVDDFNSSPTDASDVVVFDIPSSKASPDSVKLQFVISDEGATLTLFPQGPVFRASP